ncbi:MAG: cyclic nucleotide-binding domain-containing protein [Rhodobacterales bacterium]|nr:cyclic nucleotide-binding domain-containing protein [Rhodobacterales bacterium]
MESTPLSQAALVQIRRVPLFAGLAPEALGWLLESAQVQSCPRDTVLFEAGDPASQFYVVLDGRVELFMRSAGTRRSVIDVLGPGETFDVAAIFDVGRYPTGARTVEDAELVVVPRDSFVARLSENFDLVLSLMASISRHLRGLVRQVGELKLKTTGQRLGSFLLGLTDAETGHSTVRLPYDKRLLASRLGMQPESLSRAFGTLREIGVHGENDRVVIDDLTALRTYCEENGIPR